MSRGGGTFRGGPITRPADTERKMDEYIDELLAERAPLREPLPDEPEDDGFEL